MAKRILGGIVTCRIERRYTFEANGKHYDVIVHPKYLEELNGHITWIGPAI